MSFNIGNYLQSINTAHTLATGESVTFVRPAKIGVAPSSRSVTVLPQPLSIDQVPDYNNEGGANAADSRAVDFVYSGLIPDVLKGDEVLSYDGAAWTVASVRPERQGGVRTVWHIIAIASGVG